MTSVLGQMTVKLIQWETRWMMIEWVCRAELNLIVLKLVKLLCIVLFVISVEHCRFQTSEELRELTTEFKIFNQ